MLHINIYKYIAPKIQLFRISPILTTYRCGLKGTEGSEQQRSNTTILVKKTINSQCDQKFTHYENLSLLVSREHIFRFAGHLIRNCSHTFRSGWPTSTRATLHILSTPKAVPWTKHCFFNFCLVNWYSFSAYQILDI